MSWFGRGDGSPRVGLINLEVAVEHRRRVSAASWSAEIFRRAARKLSQPRSRVQTSAANRAALSLYVSLGFQTVDHATLYRLPADRFPSPMILESSQLTSGGSILHTLMHLTKSHEMNDLEE